MYTARILALCHVNHISVEWIIPIAWLQHSIYFPPNQNINYKQNRSIPIFFLVFLNNINHQNKFIELIIHRIQNISLLVWQLDFVVFQSASLHWSFVCVRSIHIFFGLLLLYSLCFIHLYFQLHWRGKAICLAHSLKEREEELCNL